jgi:hypothetical protein
VKTASFTVRATLAQSERWKRAADAEGYTSAGGWLADAADAYLKARARAGRPLPLAWRRGRFSVKLDGGELVTVSGHMSPPFGSFCGTGEGPSAYTGRKRHVLVHLPGSNIIATLRSYRQCTALASELAPVLLRGALPDSAPIVERHVRETA